MDNIDCGRGDEHIGLCPTAPVYCLPCRSAPQSEGDISSIVLEEVGVAAPGGWWVVLGMAGTYRTELEVLQVVHQMRIPRVVVVRNAVCKSNNGPQDER